VLAGKCRQLNGLLKNSEQAMVPPAEAGSGKERKGLDAGLKASSTRTTIWGDFLSKL
jgi:hypothetical protein